MPKKHRKPNKKAYTIVVGILFLIISTWIMTVLKGVFVVSHIICTLDDLQPCPSQLLEATQTLEDSSLFFTDHSFVLTSTSLNYPADLDTIQKQLPGTLHINFDTQPIWYAIQYQEEVFAVSASGKILSDPTQVITPIITIATSSAMTDNAAVKPEYHAALKKIIHSLNNKTLSPRSIVVFGPHHSVIHLADSSQIIIDTFDSYSWVQKYLYVIEHLKNFPEDVPQPYQLDLRFKQPIIRGIE